MPELMLGASAGVGALPPDLELMFPDLDPALIGALCAEAPTAEHALESLLALSAAAGGPGAKAGRSPPPAPAPVGLEDHEKFPTLTMVDSEGWQVLGSPRAPEAADEGPQPETAHKFGRRTGRKRSDNKRKHGHRRGEAVGGAARSGVAVLSGAESESELSDSCEAGYIYIYIYIYIHTCIHVCTYMCVCV